MVTSTKEFAPLCDECGELIGLRDGDIYATWWEIVNLPRLSKAYWDARTGEDGCISFSTGDDEKRPSPITWHVKHFACTKDDGYSIGLYRIDCIEKALGWTFHLQEKIWFEHTNWRSVIGRLFDVQYG